ncbi:chaperone [Lithospermum erythrorhizon]|uniref:Chaperone n=1 Tax=Lithospermum erythrorhizon TaxID=34254 RepID=A0AAV3QPE7_LITER
MAGASVRQSLQRPCSGRKTLRRCRNNVINDNVVFIDVDGDDVENVIVIDSPELFVKKRGGASRSKVKEHQKRVVICIDDEESSDNKHPDTGVKNRRNFSSGASSSMQPRTADNHDQFQKVASDGTEFVQENIPSPVTISKCKRTYSGKAPARNRYGLGPEFNDDFFNEESLDCELVEEDSFGTVREQWEKAFSKRKYENRNGQTSVVDCSKTSKASCNANCSEEKYDSEHPKEPPFFSSSEKVNCETGGASPSTVAGNIAHDTTFTSKRPSSADPALKSVLNEHGPYNQYNSHYGSDNLAEKSSMNCGEEYTHNLKYHGCNFPNAEPEGASFNPRRHSAEEVDPATESSQLREKSEAMEEGFSKSPQEHRDQASCNSKSGNRNDRSGNGDYNVSPDAKNYPPESNAAEQLKKIPDFSISGKENDKRKISSPLSAVGNLSREPFSKRGNFGGHILKSLQKRHYPYNKTYSHSTLDPLVEASTMNYDESHDQYFEHHNHQSEDGGPVPECKNSSKNVDPSKKALQGNEEIQHTVPCMRNYSPGEKAFSYEKVSSEEKLWPGRSDELLHTDPSSKDTNSLDHDFPICTDKVGTRHSKISSHSTCDINPQPHVDSHPVNETFSSNYVDEVVPLHEKSGDHFGSAESCMIGDREKLKETDVYKKAIEEEWASRRRVLQIQAEEAKELRRLKKRENAERLRLLDMERRQKQRVEEIRETNKKDEEQMNMKETIRSEVRNKLSKVEKSCHDMASLLRSLGIQVGSEVRPNADEVRVACKKALFAFHPDRASKSNTREQVEAEEKFKLICRMKEKFSVA